MTPMIVQCTSCRTEFELDPHKVPRDGVRARCSVCAAVIAVPPPPPAETPAAGGSGAAEPERRQAEPQGAPAGTQWHDETSHEGAPIAVAAPEEERDPSRGAAEAPPSEWAPAASERREAGPAAEREGASAAPRRSINPFLSRDPGLRAKRLARALVSDIVAYHPARHAEGLRDGTLKQLFRDEIRKSHEEYVDQVGQEFADSTAYFRDALNDVLAGGKRIF